MAQIPPHILNPGTPLAQNLTLINDNFDKAVQNLADLGANVTSTALVSFTLAATSTSAQSVAIISNGQSTNAPYYVTTQQPVASISALAAQADIYVDNDNNANYLWPMGTLLSSGQLALFTSVTPASARYTNTVGTYIIVINNRDSSPHTYYIHTRAGYLPGAATGVFR